MHGAFFFYSLVWENCFRHDSCGRLSSSVQKIEPHFSYQNVFNFQFYCIIYLFKSWTPLILNYIYSYLIAKIAQKWLIIWQECHCSAKRLNLKSIDIYLQKFSSRSGVLYPHYLRSHLFNIYFCIIRGDTRSPRFHVLAYQH